MGLKEGKKLIYIKCHYVLGPVIHVPSISKALEKEERIYQKYWY